MTNTLLPTGSTDYEKAIATGLSHISTLDVPIATLWNPDTCPLIALPVLAFGLGVTYWDTSWTESIKRNVCKSAFSVHRKRGTIGAVKEALQATGANVDIIEWFDIEPQGIPGTFTASVSLNAQTIENDSYLPRQRIDLIKQVLDTNKNLRSHYTLSISAEYSGDFGIGSKVQALTVVRI